MVILYLLSAIYAMNMVSMAVKTGQGYYLELQRQLPGQLVYFIAGAAGYYNLQYLTKNAKWLVPMAVIAFVFQSWLPWVIVQPMALAILVVWFACVLPSFGKFDKYGDFSYGIYIVHFPILQIMISHGYFKDSPWIGLLLTGILVMMGAYLLWHFIEKPFLRKSSHYVAENHS